MRIIKIGNLIYENIEPKKLIPVKFDEQGNPIEFKEQFISPFFKDIYALKHSLKDTLDWLTAKYIVKQVESIGEDLYDLVSEANYIEGRILFILARNGITNITTDYIKRKIAELVGGTITLDDAKTELNNLQFRDEKDKEIIIKLLSRAIFIAKVLSWKEEIWELEEKLEQQIDAENDINKLLNIDLLKLVEQTYPPIGAIL